MKNKLGKIILTCLIPCLTIFAGFLLLDLAFPLPLPDKEDDFALAVLAEDGSPLRFFPDRDGVWRYPVTLEDVSPNYLKALITYEDRWFWQHPGVNPWSLIRALWVYLQEGEPVLGGSTLTMQVARILDPHSKTIPGKLKQIFRALQLEYCLSKEEILKLYLNYAPFGGTMQGIQAACYAYLGKPARELSRAEAGLRAVLPQAPSRLRPDRHLARAERARNKVLERMLDFGVWDKETVNRAKKEKVRSRSFSQPFKAPLLARRLLARHKRQGAIKTGIDPYLQETVRSVLKSRVSNFPSGTSAAALILENKTLYVKAYAGSADYFNKSRFGCVDMVRAIRSPGSTLKPFLYAFALEEGLIHSKSLLMDAPISISGYRPENFTQGFAGPVSASEALIRSLNIPAVDLLDRLGPDFFEARLMQGGLDLDYPGRAGPNLSMILGGVGTSLEDLVGAYSCLARQGLAGQPRLCQAAPLRQRRMVQPGAAYIIKEILYSNKRPDLPGGRLFLDSSRRVAWKTGTSYGYRDAWCIGVTDTHTLGVWVGRPDGTPTPGFYGRAVAAPILFTLVDSLPRSYIPEQETPDSISRQEICWPLGLTPKKIKKWKSEKKDKNQLCQVKKTAWVLNNVLPPTLPDRNNDIWLANPRKILVNPKTGLRVEADCPVPETDTRWIAKWPRAAGPWLHQRFRKASKVPPLDPVCKKRVPTSPKNIKIVGLQDQSILRPPGTGLKLPKVTLTAIGGQEELYWLLDGKLIARTGQGESKTYRFESPGDYRLTVMDLAGNFDSIELRVAGVRTEAKTERRTEGLRD